MRKIAILLLFLVVFNEVYSQQIDDRRVITTAVPFLLVAADARAAGMGDMGVATTADVFSQQWNPAKYAFAPDEHGVSFSYTPYLTELVNDISLGQVTYYNRFNERSAFATSLRYFGLGEVILRRDEFDPGQVVKPNELALDLSYSLKLSDQFAMAVAGRYIRSQLRIPDDLGDASAANGFAFDVAGFYQSREIAFEDFNGRFRAGFNLQNLGPKMSYDNDGNDLNSNFLPANMRVGAGFDFILDAYNTIGVTTEFSKLLVPTPNAEGDIAEYQSIGWVSGIFQSFSDAPDGFREEIQEVIWAVGAEYIYQDAFALRLGYFSESERKGARKFFTLGAGFRYNVVKIDVSYLFSNSRVRNPLENTLRFSLSFNFGDKYDAY